MESKSLKEPPKSYKRLFQAATQLGHELVTFAMRKGQDPLRILVQAIGFFTQMLLAAVDIGSRSLLRNRCEIGSRYRNVSET